MRERARVTGERVMLSVEETKDPITGEPVLRGVEYIERTVEREVVILGLGMRNCYVVGIGWAQGWIPMLQDTRVKADPKSGALYILLF